VTHESYLSQALCFIALNRLASQKQFKAFKRFKSFKAPASLLSLLSGFSATC